MIRILTDSASDLTATDSARPGVYTVPLSVTFADGTGGLDETGKILWVKEPEFEVDQKAIPRVITDVQENGTAMQVDNQRKRYVKTEEFDEDKPNGYGRFKVFLLRRKLKKH